MSVPADTIAALATPAGTSAIALVRASGPDTSAIAQSLCGRPPRERFARHVNYRAVDGTLLDDVLVTFFGGPRSYTGEDSLEISCHGNPFIARKILDDLFARGCRPAGPGEFTQRAFLNGRMDLSQAEAVMDLIRARSERALAVANQQLRGALGRRIEGLIARVLGVLSQVEAYIDFPDEDLPPENRQALRDEVYRIYLIIKELIDTERAGSLLRDGIATVILGLPNAGKSSLLNALIGRDRSIVSPEPGTTRDFVEESVSVGPHHLRLVDTAGLNPSPAPLEKLGISKTLELAAGADLFLLVVDGSQPFQGAFPEAVLARVGPHNAIVVRNKADLPPALPRFSLDITAVEVSALTGEGLDALRARIVALADAFTQRGSDGIAVNARHAEALGRARDALDSAVGMLGSNAPVELLASDLRESLSAFGEITGHVDNERMLDLLFSTFCIGK